MRTRFPSKLPPFFSVGIGLLLILSPGCSDEKAPAPVNVIEAAPKIPTPPKVTAERRDLFFRYKDPKTSAYTTSNVIDEIPASARGEVVIYDPTNDVAGWFFVADLRTPGADGSFPCEARPSSQMGGTARVTQNVTAVRASEEKTVRFYTASWCGVCRKARSFMKKEQIPFVEKDIEKDSGARGELERAAKKAGLPASSLNGVPIFVIGQEMISGFDPSRIRQLARGR